MSYDDTIKMWDAAARTTERSSRIHPTGGDEEAYELSGFHAARRVMQLFPPSKYDNVLDYGCGDARVLRHLAGRYKRACGFDTSPAMCLAAQLVAPPASISTHLEDFGDIRAVFSWAVFIHHTHEAGARMIAELARFFPAATLALQIPLYEVAREPQNWTDVGVWTEKTLRDACDAAGLTLYQGWVSPGEFRWDRIGRFHDELQVLVRRTP